CSGVELEAIRMGPSPIQSLAQPNARRTSPGPATICSGSRCSTAMVFSGVGHVAQVPGRPTPGKTRRRPADGRTGRRASESRFDLAGGDQRPGKAEADTGRADRQPMIQRDAPDGFELAVEPGVKNSGADALSGEIGETSANRIRTARKRGEIDQPDLGSALAR